MKILFIGDIFGSAGIKAIEENLAKLKQALNYDLVIANAENTTNCRGLSLADYKKLKALGIDYFTMGNHTWRQNDWKTVINQPDIIRPLNIIDDEKQAIGSGNRIIVCNNKKIRIINLIGSSLKSNYLSFSNPFIELAKILATPEDCDLTLIDFHAETTSEKNAFLQAFKNQVQIILGTHTHVQTNDARIVDNTAFITDVGMTGPYNGVIGADPTSIIEMFQEKNSYFRLVEATGPYQLSAVLIEIDDEYNIPISIKNYFIH